MVSTSTVTFVLRVLQNMQGVLLVILQSASSVIWTFN